MAPYDLLEKEPVVGKPPARCDCRGGVQPGAWTGAELRLGVAPGPCQPASQGKVPGTRRLCRREPSPCPRQSWCRCPSEGTGRGRARAGVTGAEMGDLPPEAPPPACRRAEGAQQLSRPVRCSDLRVDSQKQRHPSGGVSVSSEMVFELEGVELGADGKARATRAHTRAHTRAGAECAFMENTRGGRVSL